MIDEYIGEIILVSFNWNPEGSLPCDGRLLYVRYNQALFSLLGYKYGGDGNTTFALPDLRGAEPCPGMMYCIVTNGEYPIRPY